MSKRKELEQQVLSLTERQEQVEKQEELAMTQRRRYISSMLGRITIAVKHSFPDCPQSKMNVHDFREKRPGVGRRSFEPDITFRPAKLGDGIGLHLLTPDDFLVTGLHRLIIPTRGDPEYSRIDTEPDIQMIPAPPFSVTGVEEMAEVYNIPEVLGHFLGAISVERSYDWPRAYK